MKNFLDRTLFDFPGNFIGALLIAQYFGSNGVLLNTGYNHTLFFQLFICLVSLPFFYKINKERFFNLIIIMVLFVLFIVVHYQLVSPGNEYRWQDLYSYIKYAFYLFIFSSMYFYFEDKDFSNIVKYLKYLFLILFLEVVLYHFSKLLGLPYITSLFESIDGRFSGIFLYHNTLVSLFALFIMSYVLFFGNLLEKYIFLTVGLILILSTGERSAMMGLFLLFSLHLFFWIKNMFIFKQKIKIFLIISLFSLIFIIGYTLFIRGTSVESIGMFFRPLIARIYFSYLSIIHLVSNSLVGFGPFSGFLPINISDVYSNEIESFIHLVDSIFGNTESGYIKSLHDSGNINSPVNTANAHNTFVLFFYYFGFIAIFVVTYILYLLLGCIKYLILNLDKIKIGISNYNKKIHTGTADLRVFFPIVSIIFLITSLPSLILLSLDNYLILISISLGHIGSFSYRLSNTYA